MKPLEMEQVFYVHGHIHKPQSYIVLVCMHSRGTRLHYVRDLTHTDDNIGKEYELFIT